MIIFFSDLPTDEYKDIFEDNNFIRKLKQSKLEPERPTILSKELSYILTTGANWIRPIGTFTLTIERDP